MKPVQKFRLEKSISYNEIILFYLGTISIYIFYDMYLLLAMYIYKLIFHGYTIPKREKFF